MVITSATIDAERFSKHFNDAPVIEVSGRLYPVEVRYRPVAGDAEDTTRDEEEQALADAVDELCRAGPGDILVFLPGEREIRDAAQVLKKTNFRGEVLPLYSRLSTAEQDRVFKPGKERRVILATNVAETSLTVPRIRYVVDTGDARVKRYSYRNKVEMLRVEPISQAAAQQRAGRCGRLADGICIRLYSEEDFAKRPAFTDPELLRSSLASVILRAKSLGLGEVEAFPFVDPPNPRAIADGYDLLAELGAVDEQKNLTSVGQELARLPLDPRVARMLVAAREEGCLAAGAHHRRRAFGAGPAPAAAGTGGGGRRAPRALRRRAIGLPLVPQAVEAAGGIRAAADLPRELPFVSAHAGMARCPRAVEASPGMA